MTERADHIPGLASENFLLPLKKGLHFETDITDWSTTKSQFMKYYEKVTPRNANVLPQTAA